MLHEGDYFGEQALLTNEPRKATVRAKTECICLTLDSDTFIKLFGKDKLNVKFVKRSAIAAESMPKSHEDDSKFDRSKSDIEYAWLKSAVSRNVLFSNLDSEQIKQVISAM